MVICIPLSQANTSTQGETCCNNVLGICNYCCVGYYFQRPNSCVEQCPSDYTIVKSKYSSYGACEITVTSTWNRYKAVIVVFAIILPISLFLTCMGTWIAYKTRRQSKETNDRVVTCCGCGVENRLIWGLRVTTQILIFILTLPLNLFMCCVNLADRRSNRNEWIIINICQPEWLHSNWQVLADRVRQVVPMRQVTGLQDGDLEREGEPGLGVMDSDQPVGIGEGGLGTVVNTMEGEGMNLHGVADGLRSSVKG